MPVFALLALGVSPRALEAQSCAPSGAAGIVNLTTNNPACVQVKVPQGRKFVLVQAREAQLRWQTGDGCQTGNCGPVSLQVLITAPGFSYAVPLAGSANAPRPDPAGLKKWELRGA